jgi:hypothetical protein
MDASVAVVILRPEMPLSWFYCSCKSINRACTDAERNIVHEIWLGSVSAIGLHYCRIRGTLLVFMGTYTSPQPSPPYMLHDVMLKWLYLYLRGIRNYDMTRLEECTDSRKGRFREHYCFYKKVIISDFKTIISLISILYVPHTFQFDEHFKHK